MKEETLQLNNFDSILEKQIKKNQINHAYLIETNDSKRIEIAYKLIQKILSFENKITIEDLQRNSDLQIIKTESQTIKKEEITELKNKFKTKSTHNSQRIYIIEEAEKLNNSSANTLLKFLEEPEENIIAILITNNRNIVINTIVSRCQIIRYFIPECINSNYKEEYIENLFSFIMMLEEKKEKIIAYSNKFLIKELSDRTSFAKFLNDILYVYNDILHHKIGIKPDYFFQYETNIAKIADCNEIVDIKNKINSINLCINRLKYNPNIKLLFDKLIILMSGVDVDV